MWIKQLMLAVVGGSSGLAVAAGVYTVFTAVGLVPRFADRTRSADHIILYENMVILGSFLGTVFSLFGDFLTKLNDILPEPARIIVLIFYGIFTGIYVGTLAISIAEILDTIPTMAHRVNIKRGIGIVVFSFGVGKLAGSLFYWLAGVYAW